jgi:hypothetical protein
VSSLAEVTPATQGEVDRYNHVLELDQQDPLEVEEVRYIYIYIASILGGWKHSYVTPRLIFDVRNCDGRKVSFPVSRTCDPPTKA